MNRRRLSLLLASVLIALAASGTAHASNAPIVINFEKDCPGWTCTETAASPVHVATVITPGWLSGDVFHYTATETMSSDDHGSVTLDLVGVLNLAQDPNLTVLHGTVTTGSWDGIDLAGAQLYASAVRLHDSIFAGSVWIMPGSAD